MNASTLTLKTGPKHPKHGASSLIVCTVKARSQTSRFDAGTILFTANMTRYTHYFDVCISNSFNSDIEDFDEALERWLDGLGTIENKRKEVLYTDEPTSSLIKGIIYSDTLEDES